MDIRISGHQVDTGDALKAHVQDRLQGIADKYFSRAISAEVTFGKGPHDVGFTCDIVAHVMKGLVLKGRHDAHDAHPAFDGTAEKIEKQLRRYMRRLKDRHAAEAIEVAEAGAYDAGYTLFAESIDEEEVHDAPLIVADTGPLVAAASRKPRPPRVFAATEGELIAHAAFMNGIKDPLWGAEASG